MKNVDLVCKAVTWAFIIALVYMRVFIDNIPLSILNDEYKIFFLFLMILMGVIWGTFCFRCYLGALKDEKLAAGIIQEARTGLMLVLLFVLVYSMWHIHGGDELHACFYEASMNSMTAFLLLVSIADRLRTGNNK